MQSRHADELSAPAAEVVPARQALHVAAPAESWYCPTAQSEHWEPRDAVKRPALHDTQSKALLEPTGEEVPTGHDPEQLSWPALCSKRPTGQLLQGGNPSAENSPG